MPSGPEFMAGVAAGSFALVFVALVAGASRWSGRERALPLAGIAAAAATLVGLQAASRLSLELLGGTLILIAGAAGLALSLAATPITMPFVLLPGAALIAYESSSGPSWIRHVAFLSIIAGCSLASQCERHDRELGTGPLLILISAGGIYATVPDTEQALVLLGATAPLALTGWPFRWARLGDFGTVGWVALAVWTVARGGVGRSTAIVGGLGSLGILVLEPLVRIWLPKNEAPGPDRAGPGPMEQLALHLALVLVASRVAGLRRSMLAATGIVAVTNLLVGWVLSARARMGGSRRRIWSRDSQHSRERDDP